MEHIREHGHGIQSEWGGTSSNVENRNSWQQVVVHYVREKTLLQRISVVLDHPRILIIPDAIHEIKVK